MAKGQTMFTTDADFNRRDRHAPKH
jgi:hypothetical protein